MVLLLLADVDDSISRFFIVHRNVAASVSDFLDRTHWECIPIRFVLDVSDDAIECGAH